MKRIAVFTALQIFILLVGCKHELMLSGKTVTFYFDNEQVADLARAGAKGDLKMMERLAKEGADVNHAGFEGITPLMWILYAKNPSGMEKILELGAHPNQKAKKNTSAVSLAAGADDPGYLELLLKHGGDPNLIGDQGKPALYIAAQQGRKKNIDLLLEYGGDIDIHTEYGRNAAMVSAAMGYFDQVYYLLERGLTHNLNGVARSVDVRIVPEKSKQYEWKQKTIEFLEKKGIKFPTSPSFSGP